MTEISNAQNPAATSDAAPKGARARPVASIAIDQIEVGARLRHLRPEKVDEIAELIAAQSLLQSIIVRRRGELRIGRGPSSSRGVAQVRTRSHPCRNLRHRHQ